MRIAICDDEQRQVDIIRNEVEAHTRSRSASVSVSTFTSAAKLLAAALQERFHIIFLDISMPQISGLDLAAQIRRMDTEVQIVFVTNMADEMPRGFDVMAAGFIVKPVHKQALHTVLDKLAAFYQRKSLKPYEVTFRGGQTGTIVLPDVLPHAYHTCCNQNIRMRILGQAVPRACAACAIWLCSNPPFLFGQYGLGVDR